MLGGEPGSGRVDGLDPVRVHDGACHRFDINSTLLCESDRQGAVRAVGWSTRVRLAAVARWAGRFASRQAGTRSRTPRCSMPSRIKADAVVGADSRGFDGGKLINGRKRHVVVDTLGLLPAVIVTGADGRDRTAAQVLLAHVAAEPTPADPSG
jgi:hypothetical protein